MSDFKNALVIGNGSSRQNFKYSESIIRTYGCNAIYRSNIKIDDLIAIDPAIQHEIYSSDYVKKRRCWFASWKSISNNRDYKALLEYVEHNKCKIIGYKSTNHRLALELRDNGTLKKIIDNEIKQL